MIIKIEIIQEDEQELTEAEQYEADAKADYLTEQIPNV